MKRFTQTFAALRTCGVAPGVSMPAATATIDADPGTRSRTATSRHRREPQLMGCRREPQIPHCDDQVRRDRKRRSNVHGVGSPQTVVTCKSSSVRADVSGQLHNPYRSPVLLPSVDSEPFVCFGEAVVATSRRDRRTNLGVRQSARNRRVAAVPKFGGDVTPLFIDEQLDECTAVEIDDGHDRVSGAARRRDRTPCRSPGHGWPGGRLGVRPGDG